MKSYKQPQSFDQLDYIFIKYTYKRNYGILLNHA